jgi:hypothetical protein
LEDILQPQLAQREAQLAAQAEAAQLAAAQARQATYIGVPGGHEPTILDEIADVANRTRVTGGAEQIAAITKRAANNAGYPPETPSGMAEPDLRPRTIERSVPLGRSRFGDEEIPEGRTILEPIETETSSRYLGRTREPGGRDYTVAPEGGIGELPKEIVESQKQSWRSGVGYLLKSADDRLREVGQRLLAYNSTAPRLTSTSLPIAERALGRMSTEEQDAVRRYITGELPDAPAHIAEAGEAIKAGVLAPIAKRSVESGRTIIRDGKVVPWEPIAENYAPEFQAAEDTLTSRQATRGGNRSGLLLSRSRKGGVETPRPDFLNVLHEYIPRQNKEIAMAENFGPLTSANPEAPYGVWTQNLLRDANEAGTDRLGVQIASKALREAYEPLLADPSLKWQRRIPARAYLAWNWLTQPRQLATAPINFGLANTIEGNARLIDPGYRRMILGSGGAVPSRGKFLEKAFDVMPESWAGKLSEATDRLNRIVTGAGAGPFIEDLESAAQKGPLNEWHARQAAEAGLNEEQLRRGLTQGEVQSAVARLVQRKQLNPSGAGERIGMLQSPGERNVSGYLDYSTGQHRLSVEDYFKPSVGILRPGQGGGLQLENRLSTAVGGLGRLGRTALYGLPVEAAMMLAADAARGRLMNPNAQPRTGQDVVTRLLESHVPLAGAAARALLPGPRQDAVSAPLASSLSDLVSMKPESIVDILMALDTMAGEPAGPFSQALTMGAEPVKNLIRAQRQAR